MAEKKILFNVKCNLIKVPILLLSLGNFSLEKVYTMIGKNNILLTCYVPSSLVFLKLFEKNRNQNKKIIRFDVSN